MEYGGFNYRFRVNVYHYGNLAGRAGKVDYHDLHKAIDALNKVSEESPLDPRQGMYYAIDIVLEKIKDEDKT